MIRASIYGRLGGDPAERTSASGKVFATASLAVNVARYGADEDTVWFSLCAFGSQADVLLRHAKGDMLGAMGQMTRRTYTGRDGAARESWSLTVEALVSARSVRPGGGKRRQASSQTAAPAPAGDGRPFDDEIPL